MDLKNIIKGCISEDKESQRALFNLFSGKMMAVCMRYSDNNIHEAEDIFQEGFIRVFDKIGQYNFKGSFEGWMRKVFVNLAIRNFQNQKRKDSFLNGYVVDESNIAEPDAFSKFSEMELIAMINSLPDGYRLVFNMYVIDGYSHKEIAEKLNIVESTSRSQLVKAKKMLRLKVGKERSYFGAEVKVG